MTFDIQTVFNYYASPFLLLTFTWFATVGYLAHAVVLMLLTKLSFHTIYQPLLRFHAMSLAIAYACTPIMVAVGQWLLQLLHGNLYHELVNLNLYLFFLLMMSVSITYFLCSFFKETSCKKFKRTLLIADYLVAVLGYFVLLLVQQNFGIIG